MAYKRTNWKNFPDISTPITADRLNNLESGVENADKEIVILKDIGSKISQDLDIIKKENVWIEWMSLHLESNVLDIVFNRKYKTRPSVTLEFSDMTDDFRYDFSYLVETSDGELLHKGIKVKIISGGAKFINMTAIGRY